MWLDLQKSAIYAQKLKFILLHRLITTHKTYPYTVLSMSYVGWTSLLFLMALLQVCKVMNDQMAPVITQPQSCVEIFIVLCEF